MKEIFEENWLSNYYNKPSAAADRIRVQDDDEMLQLTWEDDGAYPFGWFYNDITKKEKVYVGDECSMHSSPTSKFAEEYIKDKIRQGASIDEFKGQFFDQYNGKELELEYSNPLSSIAYMVDEDGIIYVTLYFDDGEEENIKSQEHELQGDLELYLNNQDTIETIIDAIDNREGDKCSDGYFVNIDEETDDIGIDEYLDAEYRPSNEELDGYIQEMEDAGRFWVYDKVICFWGWISPSTLESCLEDLKNATNIDFNDYRIVYSDEETEEVKIEPIQDYINNSTQEDVQTDMYQNGRVLHLMNGDEKCQDSQMQSYLKDRESNQSQKLVNSNGKEMSRAEYTALRRPYSEMKEKLYSISMKLNETIKKYNKLIHK